MSRPKVVVLNSASVDGRIAISPHVPLLYGDRRWQAIEEWSPASEPGDMTERLKAIHSPQATLEGSGSFVRAGDEPASLPPPEGDVEALYQDFLPQSIVQRPGHRGWFTAVDGRGRIRWGYKDGAAFGENWVGWYALVLVGRHTPAPYLAYLRRESIPYLVAGQSGAHVDLTLALQKMRSRLGITCVLSTAGGRLNGALLRQGVVDEINVEYLPAVIGGRETPSLFASTGLGPDELPTRLALVSVQVHAGGRVWVRYRVVPAGEER
jgi:riboflavin biosynthesis pyrimidine reductase